MPGEPYRPGCFSEENKYLWARNCVLLLTSAREITMPRIILVVLTMSVTMSGQLQSRDDHKDLRAGTSFVSSNLDWSQTLSRRLIGGARERVTLTPCPAGIDTTSEAGYQVSLSGGGHTEAANVLSAPDGCTSEAPSGTITLIPFFSYPEGSTIGSASAGVQEMINVACGVDPTPWKNNQCKVELPANGPQVGSEHSIHTYNISGTIFFHSNQSMLSGYGASLNCIGRGPCLQVGNLKGSNDFAGNTVAGLSFRSPKDFSSNPSYHGVRIVATRSDGWVSADGGNATSWCASHSTACTRTITTDRPHGFRAADLVTSLFTDDPTYWGDAIVYDCGSGITGDICTPNSTTFRYLHSTRSIASQTTPGVVALAYEAILDNGNKTNLTDLQYDKIGEVGAFNNFFDFWDDENAIITRFGSTTGLNGNANWIGSFVFSAGNQGPLNQIAPVITLRDSTITAINPAATVYNSNGLYIENSVLQASGPWQVYSSNTTGNYQGAYLKNIYSESSVGANPLFPPRSPFAGTGIAGLIVGPTSASATFQIDGNGGLQGSPPTYGSCPGKENFYYYIVVHDLSTGASTSPLWAEGYCSTGSDSPTVHWPRVANATDVITYDIIRGPVVSSPGDQWPSFGNCNGGSQIACGSVATGISQIAACANNLTCSYTDKASASPSPYTMRYTSNYQSSVLFWPGTIVSVNKTVLSNQDNGGLVGFGLSGAPIATVPTCNRHGMTGANETYTVCGTSNATTGNSQPATLLVDGSPVGSPTGLKGRLNFSYTSTSLFPTAALTLLDSNVPLTRSTIGFRPPWSASDTWIGYDPPPNGVALNQGQLALGAPVSISYYINALPNGLGGKQPTNWMERLTSEQKTFAVPVKIEEGNSLTLGSGTPLSRIMKYNVSNVGSKRISPQTCIDIVVRVDGVSKSDQIAAWTPAGALGNLSVNAYAGDKDAVVLHFCNPSTSEALTPAGTYSFLAIR